ncbi:MAG TPA: ferritin [Symbiobacteriaceae bacterium]|nr:ferritin [Symbiobacteriaceae bacterium]
MLPKTMADGLNAQVRHEMESAYIYLAMAAYCEAKDELGFAQWLRVQAKEELEHAMRFYDFVHDRGGRVVLQAIAQPPVEFGSMVELFEQVLQHEVKISSLIHHLYELAVQEKDYASLPFLQGFIVEQVEEEKTAADVLAQIKRAGQDMAAVIQLNKALGERV